jgi:hypothetical protein
MTDWVDMIRRNGPNSGRQWPQIPWWVVGSVAVPVFSFYSRVSVVLCFSLQSFDTFLLHRFRQPRLSVPFPSL